MRAANRDVPEEVVRHLDECGACRSTWEFLVETDPLLQAHREQTFGVVLREVLAEDGHPVPAQNESAAEEYARVKEMLDRTLEKRELTASDMIQASKIVCSAEDEDVRADLAEYLAGRLRREPERADDYDLVAILMDSRDETINLTKRKAESPGSIDVEMAVQFLVSQPHTSMLREQPVLDYDPDTQSILFHPARMSLAISKYKNRFQPRNTPSAQGSWTEFDLVAREEHVGPHPRPEEA